MPLWNMKTIFCNTNACLILHKNIYLKTKTSKIDILMIGELTDVLLCQLVPSVMQGSGLKDFIKKVLHAHINSPDKTSRQPIT